MKAAVYQAPFLPSGSMASLGFIRKQISVCESAGVTILCCPEAILGGLADYADSSHEMALNAESGELAYTLAPLSSEKVTTIVGFTEKDKGSKLYNSAAVFHHGRVFGIYRKLHPAIRRSVYTGGDQHPVFTVDGLTFGILICNDSNFAEAAKIMVSKGASALFIPTNTGLPLDKADVVADARHADIALARANDVWILRSDVVGRSGGLVSYGSSCIIEPGGNVLMSAKRSRAGLLIADIKALHGDASAFVKC